MIPQKILYIAHNHPSLHPGGTEIMAYDLFRAMQLEPGVTAAFLACTNHLHREPKPGTRFQAIGRNGDEFLLWSGHFDRFYQSQVDLHGIVPELERFLIAFQPDIIHVHHTLLLGVEMLFLIRRVLPDAKIVYTLHDYYPICTHEGQMVKTTTHALCRSASPDACHACFPKIGTDKFVLRDLHLKNMFRMVDHFLAPSAFLRQRYIDWGIAADRIGVMANGRPRPPEKPAPRASHQRRAVFGYFGNLNPFKGVLTALEAVRHLIAEQEGNFELRIHGGMPFQSDAFRTNFETALAAAPLARSFGAYDAETLPGLLAAVDWVVVPSIWWENAPLVIQEAFQAGRPVICSGIGGMAEMVTDGVNGLHAKPGDAVDLVRVMLRAMNEPRLWRKLAAGIPAIPDMVDRAEAHLALYARLQGFPLPDPAHSLSERVAGFAADAGIRSFYRPRPSMEQHS